MIRTAAPLLLVLLAACAAPPAPQAVTTSAAAAPAAPRDRLIAAIEDFGCVYSRANSGDVLLRANLTQAEAVPILLQLGAEGRAEPGGAEGSEAVRVLTERCI